MNDKQSVAVILAAAGKSSRFSNGEQAVKKPFAQLHGKPVWLHGAERFHKREDVKQLIIVVSPDDITWFRQYYAEDINRLLLIVVAGGEHRVDSVRNGLKAVEAGVELVAIHDAARPCIRDKLIDAVFDKARSEGAALLASPIVGTIKQVTGDRIEATVSRDKLWEAQTPQVFQRQILFDAFDRAVSNGAAVTDDASLVEQAGYAVYIIPSEQWNLKITTQTDLTIAEIVLSAQNSKDGDDLSENIVYDNTSETFP